MTLTEFQLWVQQNAEWFQGVHPETDVTIAQAEQRIGHLLPSSLTWLLINWGYSTACGVDSLAYSVATTLRLRRSLNLPERYIVLNDWQDVGIVFLDVDMPRKGKAQQEVSAHEYCVYWAATHNLERLARHEAMNNDVDTYANFPEWVAARLEFAKGDAQ